MSSKKSKLKPSWSLSNNGDGFVLTKPKSANNCEEEDANNLTISSEGILSAQVTKMKERDLKVTDRVRNSILELHPDTMQLCRMRLGGPVLVETSSGNRCAFRVWPFAFLALGKAAFSIPQMKLLELEENDFVVIYEAQSFCFIASRIELQMVDEKPSDFSAMISKFSLEYFHQLLDRQYIIPKQLITVHYFGKMLKFRVLRAEAENAKLLNETENITNSDTSLLEGSIANLSLMNTNNCFKNLNCSQDHVSENKSSIPPIMSTPKQTQGNNSKHNLLQTPIARLNKMVPSYNQHTSIDNDLFLVYQIHKTTKVIIVDEADNCHQSGYEDCEKNFSTDRYSCIGGLDCQIKILKETVELPMRRPELFRKAGLAPSTGILLHGPPGTGKSMLARAVAHETLVKTIMLKGPEIMSRYFGDSEQNLRSLFDQARDQAPSVIIIDELDAICPLRESAKSDVEKRIVSSFITLLDGVTSANCSTDKYVVILATTNRIDSIDPALRRAGRFDREIEIPIPSPEHRFQIFTKLLKDLNHDLNEEDISTLAERAHGYVGADISSVCKEAGMHGLRRNIYREGECPINFTDFDFGMKQVPPSAMRELIIQVPKVLWSDIGGNAGVKKKLKQAIEWPLKNPEAFNRLGIEPPRGVLLYGPPGCSKTLIAKALATESGLNFISVKGPELFSKYVGDSERAIRRIFSKARSAAPSIVFVDELDALAIERGGRSSKGGNNVADRVLAAMLTEMDGVEQRHDVIVVAATNRPDMIDKALLRPGRIDRIVYIPLPNAVTRQDIFRIQFRKTPVSAEVDLDWLVKTTENYSGAEICAVCREAALAALDADMQAQELTTHDFEIALSTVHPQTTKQLVSFYEEYSKTLQTQIK